MVAHYKGIKNRSNHLLNIMDLYLKTFDNVNFEGFDERTTICISKPNEKLYSKMYSAIKGGFALSRSELFRQAILWDMQRVIKVNRKQLEKDKRNGVVRVPTNEPKELVYKVIGIA